MEKIRANKTITSKHEKRPGSIRRSVFPWIIVAAIALGVILITSRLLQNPTSRQTKFVYNEGMIGYILREIPINYVEEKWEAKETVDLLPPPAADGMVPEVYPGFGEDGKLVKLRIVYARENPDMKIHITWLLPEYGVTALGKSVSTTRGELTYLVCQQYADIQGVSSVILGAKTQIDDIEGVFYMEGPVGMEAQMKMEFEFLLNSFGEYPPQKEAFHELQPKGKLYS